MQTRVYIDGFNLYHGAISGKPLKWLNLSEFGRRMNGGTPPDRILYCTAMVSSSPDNPKTAERQDAYLNPRTARQRSQN